MGRSKRVLLVEDDAPNRNALTRFLTSEGWSCTPAESPARALPLVNEATIDVVLTDMFFRGSSMNGHGLVVAIRAIPSRVPIMVYSAGDWTEQERATILRAGADAIMSMPLLAPKELFAWLDMLTWRGSGTFPAEPLRIGELSIDLSNHLVRVRDETLTLTRKQWPLLCALATCTPRPVSYDELAHHVGLGDHYDRHALSTAVQRLRARLEGTGVDVEAVPGVGYRLAIARHRAASV